MDYNINLLYIGSLLNSALLSMHKADIQMKKYNKDFGDAWNLVCQAHDAIMRTIDKSILDNKEKL